MNPDLDRPVHQPDTEFTGEVQQFSGVALSPTDPSLEPRVRRGRPSDRPPDAEAEAAEDAQG